MEMSIGGYRSVQGYRATINSYQYGDAVAISRIALLNKELLIAEEFRNKSIALKFNVESVLWDKNASFFKVLPRKGSPPSTPLYPLVDVRELHGYTPWAFNLPSPDKSIAWSEVLDSKGGFLARYGLTTAEQRHANFTLAYDTHECQWNGPSWPFATSMTLTALANLLNNYQQNIIKKRSYLDLVQIYAKSQYRIREKDGKKVPWIDENLHPYTGR